MNTTLTLELLSCYNSGKTHADFFAAEYLSGHLETVLVQHIHNLLRILRPVGKELNIQFNARVSDANHALFLVNRQKYKMHASESELTPRESEIFELIIKGYTNGQIAGILFISVETVRTHRKHILSKTKTKNTASLVNYYYNKISNTV